MKHKIKITVATVTYNAASTLSDAIESVVNQSYSNLEYLIIDGASKDNTFAIAQDYANKYSFIKIRSEPDNGIYDAMNKAQGLAVGDFILFLGSDDVLYDNFVIETFIKQITNYNSVYYGDVLGKDIQERWFGIFTLEKLLLQNIPHQAIFYPKSIYKNYTYNLKYKTFSDWDYNLKLWSQHVVFTRIDIIVTLYAETGISVTNPDQVFLNDRNQLIKRYFGSKHTWLLIMQKVKQKLIGNADLRKVKVLLFPKLK